MGQGIDGPTAAGRAGKHDQESPYFAAEGLDYRRLLDDRWYAHSNALLKVAGSRTLSRSRRRSVSGSVLACILGAAFFLSFVILLIVFGVGWLMK